MTKKSIVVNLFAGPGAGKSTTMATVFAMLKWKGIDCEMAPEYAKKLVWKEDFKTLSDQSHVTETQFADIRCLDGKVKAVITDGPILLGLIYGKDLTDIDKTYIHSMSNEFTNINVYLDRVKPYNPNGRMQNEDEAKKKDSEVLNLLNRCRIPYKRMSGTYENALRLVDIIENIINDNINVEDFYDLDEI